MGYYADIYVIKKTRSKKDVIDFLNHFMPERKESTNEYLIPQYSDQPKTVFTSAEGLMSYLQMNSNIEHSIYWNNLDKQSLNEHLMVFYTTDAHIIFGISRNTSEINEKFNQEDLLNQMKIFLKSNYGYITFESPPETDLENFLKNVYPFQNEQNLENLNEPINIHKDSPKIYLGMGIYNIYIVGGWYVKPGRFQISFKNMETDAKIFPEESLLKLQDFYKNEKIKKIFSVVVNKGGEYEINFIHQDSIILKKYGFPFSYFLNKIDSKEIEILIKRN